MFYFINRVVRMRGILYPAIYVSQLTR